MLADRSSPKCRDLDDLATVAHMRKAEAPTNQAAVTEQRLDLFRRRARCDIEVLGVQLEHGIAHTAANEEGLVARLVQSVQNLECALGKLGPGDVVIRSGDYSWFYGPVLRVLLQQLIRLEIILGAV